MSIDLPKPIALYFAAENGNDPEGLAECFTQHALVRDEGQTVTGLPAIQQWMRETRRKYRHRMQPLAWVEKDGNAMVTNRLTGDFPGSPIELAFVFTLEGDKIARLEIRPRAAA